MSDPAPQNTSAQWIVEGYEPAPFATEAEAIAWRNARSWRRFPQVTWKS